MLLFKNISDHILCDYQLVTCSDGFRASMFVIILLNVYSLQKLRSFSGRVRKG